MGKIYNSVTELIGGTPLLKANNFIKANGLKANIFVKLEYFNPAGSVKDRIAKAMIEQAEKDGKFKPGATIIEPTSGNTGIGLASVAAARGYPANPAAHEATTGPEIYNDLDGKVDAFIAGVGTGGTLSGVGHYLKKQDKGIHVVAVEPETSPVLSKGQAGPHKIQGIGAGFVPETLDTKVYDEVIAISNDDAFKYGRQFSHVEGVLIGISSGAALAAAIELAKRPEFEGKNIVALLPDTGDRYLSTELFAE